MLLALIVLLIVGLLAYNAAVFALASGTVAERLAAAWKNSATLFVGVWFWITSVMTVGLDGLASLTGDPMFAQWSASVKAVIPPQYHPWIPIAGLTATMLARLRTANK